MKIGRAAVVEIRWPTGGDSLQRRGTELGACRISIRKGFRELRAHVVEEEINLPTPFELLRSRG